MALFVVERDLWTSPGSADTETGDTLEAEDDYGTEKDLQPRVHRRT
jgi:hypothetical protein